MSMQERIEEYFNAPARRAELVELTSRLVKIKSVRGDASPETPYGPGPAAALAEALRICQEQGFTTHNYENYVGTADLNGHETCLHILGHLDVVGEGTGWTVTEPYEPKEIDGMLYGRGACDDKGPVVCALLAMKAVRDLGFPLKSNVRLIMGTDEESGSSDLEYYYAREPYAPYAFTPDASFPVINTEKGRYSPQFPRRWAEETALPRVREFHGGFRVNVLPGEAQCVIAGLSAGQVEPLCTQAAAETGVTFTLEESGEDLRILAHGKGAHASLPEDGNNGITALLHLLALLPLAPCESTGALRALHALFPHGDSAGKALGIAQSDEVSGPLTVCFSLLDMDGSGVSGQFDCRASLCANEENCKAVAEAALAKAGFTAEGSMEPGHHTPAEGPFIQTLLRSYETYSGRKGECLAMGGGTYVHHIPGGVAFGCDFPGFNGNMHGANEFMCLDDMLTACKIFTQAIAELCG